MTDPIADIIGDYRAFAAQQRNRLLERHASANPENVWNGRPISLILPEPPLQVLDG
jgi:hypothetical protein